ncbi:photosystem reaction center subunit H [Microvirga ossetica]|uniref:Photosystem reaction center subunit H n=1 Tax=Microvirga ossetica TaxID=1882682 RepID=A0A1B2EI22_9HYPH|nr:PRC-barrel domain-containing protein [Microvirga ossetica]ANY79599.1 photosystem reaction center subunit H [Microvirga ossetica]
MPTKLPNEREMRQPGSMELDPAGEGVAIEETQRLIASSKVEGTPVFNRAGEQLGTVYNFMVDKVSGQVAYVVMSFGGFLGIGESYHPLPWRALTYDTRLGGYVVDIDKDRLSGAPRYEAGEDPFMDDEYGARVDAYYRTTPTA